jgi:sugar lactone lactonase YvrE
MKNFFVFAAALLVACSQTPPASSVPSALQTFSRMTSPTHSPLPAPVNRRIVRSWLSPQARAANARLIYAANYNDGRIDIYPEKGRLQNQVGQIGTGIFGPWGLYVDTTRSLYVVNSSANTVTVYPSGSTSPSNTYSRGLDRPLYAIVDHQKNLYVGNANDGTITEYLGGNNSTFRTLQSAGSEVDGMDFDRQGNLYVAYRNANAGGVGSVEIFTPGSATGNPIGMTLNQPQGIVVDDSGNILAVETGGTNRIDVFPPGSQTPSMQIPIPNSYVPTQLSLKRNGTQLLVSTGPGWIYGSPYPFPSQPQLLVKDFDPTFVQGVAFSDDQTF